MSKDNLYVLIHSPLVGPTTWKRVAQQMQQRDIQVVLPALIDSPNSKKPFWKQHAEAVAQAFAHVCINMPVTLVAHSGAGPLLPAIRETLANPVRAYVFVDASVPTDGASRLDLMMVEDPDWAREFQQELERGGQYPTWKVEDLKEVIPNETLCSQTVAEMQPRGLGFFTEPIPVFSGWPDAPCVYIRLSAPYQKPAKQAQQAGWRTYEVEAGHFHMLVDPETVTNLIVQ